MAITDKQRAGRRHGIGSSDARRIMEGDWLSLWLEKTDRTAPDDLDFVPAVQIGVATEGLHPRFWERRTGLPAIPASDRTHVHPAHPWLLCHPDFLTWSRPPLSPDDAPDTILEAKFCGAPKSDAELAEQYFWQVQHQMLVTGLDNAVLSILRPSAYGWIAVPADPARQAVLLATAAAFWWHVENDVEPGDPLPVPAPDLETLRVLDMSRHNGFASHAATLRVTRAAWTAYRTAEVELKSLMPEEAAIAFVPADGDGDAVCLARSKDGRLSLRFGSPPPRHAARATPWEPTDY